MRSSSSIRSSPTTRLVIDEPSRVGEARRIATAIAIAAGLDEQTVARVALVVSELATNLVKHAREGEIFIRPIALHEGGASAVEIAGADLGPGMDLGRAMRDGYSTAGSRGVGLGAIERASALFDAFSGPGGSVILSRVAPDAARAARDGGVGAVATPHPSEEISGDGWLVARQPGRTLVAVVDGLGHGPAAAEATRRLLEVVEQEARRAPGEILEIAHRALHGTRGAAASIAAIDHGAAQLVYAGIGNVAGDVHRPDGSTQSCVSMHGIVGAQVRKVRELSYEIPSGSLLVMCSDGIASSFRLDKTPGLASRHPALIAAAVLRQQRRGRDDATVVALREEAAR